MTNYDCHTKTFQQLGTQEEIDAIHALLNSNLVLNEPNIISAHANDLEPFRICVSFYTSVYSARTILAEIKAGHMIQAIKQFRSLNDTSLKDAKLAVETIREALNHL